MEGVHVVTVSQPAHASVTEVGHHGVIGKNFPVEAVIHPQLQLMFSKNGTMSLTVRPSFSVSSVLPMVSKCFPS